MPSQLETLAAKVAGEKARRAAERSREVVAWEPRPLWLWASFWSFASREYAPGSRTIDLDLMGWQALIRTVAAADSDDAALAVVLAWADTAYCGQFSRCTPYNLSGPKWQGPNAYDLLRDIVAEHRRRTGDSRNVSWLADDEVTAEGRALVLAELAADRASGELLRPDPWERFFEGEEQS